MVPSSSAGAWSSYCRQIAHLGDSVQELVKMVLLSFDLAMQAVGNFLEMSLYRYLKCIKIGLQALDCLSRRMVPLDPRDPCAKVSV